MSIVIYDASMLATVRLAPPLMSLLFGIVSAGVTKLAQASHPAPESIPTGVQMRVNIWKFLSIASYAVFALSAFLLWAQYNHDNDTLQTKTYITTIGAIENFTNHKGDYSLGSFTVSGIKFNYLDGMLNKNPLHLKALQSAIDRRMPVSIWHKDRAIVHIEIPQ
jgi:hypothetical protein